jgi:uncharacterized protein (DUF2235 family)
LADAHATIGRRCALIKKGELLMVTRLVLCFDGTWDRPSAGADPLQRVETNVVRFYRSVLDGKQPDGSVQKKWYDTGVGTNWWDRVSGAVLGFGLDDKIREGYRFLVQNYPDPDPGDHELFLLGFSRGAYEARSLVGMIRNVGLLKPDNLNRLHEAYALYRKRDRSADTDEAQSFRTRFSRKIKVRFLGVWDTVGALGIPISALQWLNAEEYGFHDTELSSIVQTAAHAVAVDEHRIDFQATLWSAIPKPGQEVEQRWFAGSHGDVGGGNANRGLSDLALVWMQRKAIMAGLAIDPAGIPAVSGANQLALITDSYHTFLSGLYALTHPIYYRPMHLATDSNQTIDASVLGRQVADPVYGPANEGFPPRGHS